MDKDKILELSRNENKDLFENEIINVGWSVAATAGLICCCILSTIQIVVTSSVRFELWVVYFVMLTSKEIVKYKRNKEIGSMFLIIFYFVLSVFFIICYVATF